MDGSPNTHVNSQQQRQGVGQEIEELDFKGIRILINSTLNRTITVQTLRDTMYLSMPSGLFSRVVVYLRDLMVFEGESDFPSELRHEFHDLKAVEFDDLETEKDLGRAREYVVELVLEIMRIREEGGEEMGTEVDMPELSNYGDDDGDGDGCGRGK